MIPTFIFDIDGTMADHRHRLHLIDKTQEGGAKWMAFHDACHLDPPIEPVCMLIKALIRDHRPVVFLTGRMEFQRIKTEQWLYDRTAAQVLQDAPGPWLLMRADQDFREDTIVKPELLDNWMRWTPGYQPVMAFEDRPRVCDMWRARGLIVAKIGDWTEAQQASPEEAWACTRSNQGEIT